MKDGTNSGEKEKVLRAVKSAFPHLKKNKDATFIKAVNVR